MQLEVVHDSDAVARAILDDTRVQQVRIAGA